WEKSAMRATDPIARKNRAAGQSAFHAWTSRSSRARGPRSRALTPVHFEPAIDRATLARYVIGVLRGKVECQASDLPRLSRPFPRNIREFLPHLSRVFGTLRRHRRADEAGRDCVDINPQWRKFERQRSGKGQQPSLRRA